MAGARAEGETKVGGAHLLKHHRVAVAAACES
jgi:hypothetical protein